VVRDSYQKTGCHTFDLGTRRVGIAIFPVIFDKTVVGPVPQNLPDELSHFWLSESPHSNRFFLLRSPSPSSDFSLSQPAPSAR
jgi:hypothetical protein